MTDNGGTCGLCSFPRRVELCRLPAAIVVCCLLCVWSPIASRAVDVDLPVASDQDIATWLGRVQYSMIVCNPPMKRAVRIEVERYSSWNGGFPWGYLWGGNPYRASLAEVTRRSILFAFQNCPVGPSPQQSSALTPAEWASVVADGEIQYEAQILTYIYDPTLKKNIYRWAKFYDFTSKNWWNWIYRWFLGLLIAAALGFALWNWEVFVRFYCQLTPHPAAAMVKDAIRARVEFDPQAFADIVREPPGSRVARDVRNKQAEKLAAMARMSNEQLRRMAEELRQQFEDQAKYHAAHGESLDAVAERLVKARADAYAKAEEFWKSRRKT